MSDIKYRDGLVDVIDSWDWRKLFSERRTHVQQSELRKYLWDRRWIDFRDAWTALLSQLVTHNSSSYHFSLLNYMLLIRLKILDSSRKILHYLIIVISFLNSRMHPQTNSQTQRRCFRKFTRKDLADLVNIFHTGALSYFYKHFHCTIQCWMFLQCFYDDDKKTEFVFMQRKTVVNLYV